MDSRSTCLVAASVAMSEVATTRRSSSIRVGTAYLLIFLCSSVDWLNHYVSFDLQIATVFSS